MADISKLTIQVEAKRWWRSKTIWFNIATGIVAFANELAAIVELLPDTYQPPVRIALIGINAVGNVWLRGRTYQGIK